LAKVKAESPVAKPVAPAKAAPAKAAPMTGARTVIRIPKTAEIVAANIRKMIIRGEVKEGDFLQPEAQLMGHFGTSRPTIREAFRILENEQLISVTRGSRSGARVHAPSVDSVARYAGLALQAQGTLLSDIYLARLGVEPFAVRLAAERRSLDHLATVRGELQMVSDMLEAAASSRDYFAAVIRLHHSIVELAGSNTLTMISAMLQGIIVQHVSNYVARDRGIANELDRKRNRGAVKSFGKVLDLIEAKDAAGAEAHWRAHMQNANDSWLMGYDQTALVDVIE